MSEWFVITCVWMKLTVCVMIWREAAPKQGQGWGGESPKPAGRTPACFQLTTMFFAKRWPTKIRCGQLRESRFAICQREGTTMWGCAVRVWSYSVRGLERKHVVSVTTKIRKKKHTTAYWRWNRIEQGGVWNGWLLLDWGYLASCYFPLKQTERTWPAGQAVRVAVFYLFITGVPDVFQRQWIN